MKRIKQQRLSEFWNHEINPITGWIERKNDADNKNKRKISRIRLDRKVNNSAEYLMD